MESSNQFLGTERIGKLMQKYAIPCIISLLVGALYNIVDQIFIANASYLGSYGNAANTVVFPLTVVALAIAVMIGDGCCAFVSISLGQNEVPKAKRSVGNAVVMCLVSSIVLAALYLIFADNILAMFGGTVNAETYHHSQEYFFYITLGVPFYMFGQAMNPIIRADGNPRFAMISTLAGAALNIILDPIFIFGFHWGMMGAAVATVIGQLVTAALADGIPQGVPVRRALWLGAVSTVCLCILSALAAAALLNKAPSFAVRLALTAGLFMELAHIIVQAQGLCAAEFSSMALLGFLPLLLWAGWGIRPASWNASARVLWWFAAVGGVICLLGLAGQLHWYRLFTPAQPTATGWGVPVYAEYFAGALLCSARSVRRTVWLPVWGFAVQAAALLGGALLFGSGAYPRLELLRAWSGGSFSRMDALLLLLWLLCAVYRAAMLCAAIRLLWQQPEAEVQP